MFLIITLTIGTGVLMIKSPLRTTCLKLLCFLAPEYFLENIQLFCSVESVS